MIIKNGVYSFMNIEINQLSHKYAVRKMYKKDIPCIYEMCLNNQQYYQYCGKQPSMELIESDLEITPPGFPFSHKYYIGFFCKDVLIAVLDLYDGFPEKDYAYIGFFMMNFDFQGKGIGSEIISDVTEYLKKNNYRVVRLGIDKDNPQSTHFWKKNQFEVIKEVKQDEGTILVAERKLF